MPKKATEQPVEEVAQQSEPPVDNATVIVSITDLTAIRDALAVLGSGAPDSMVHRKQIAAPALEILNALLPE